MIVSAAATEQLSKLLKPGESLQIGLKGGGCGGATLEMDKVDLTNISDSNIAVIGTENVVWADQTSARYLTGGSLDIDNSIFNARFVYRPLKGTDACGCGESIKLEPKE